MRIFQPTVTGSNTTTGSLHISGPVHFYTLNDTSVSHILTYNTESGQVYYTASSQVGTLTNPAPPSNSIQFNSGGAFGGSSNLTYDSTSNLVSLTGSLHVIYGSNNYYNLLVTESSGKSYVTIGDTQDFNNHTYLILDDHNGTIELRADTALKIHPFTLSESPETNVLVWNSGTGQVYYTSSNALIISPFPFTGSAGITGSIVLTGSMFVSGAISASFGPNTVGFYGTASWAQSASFAATAAAAPSDTYIQYNKNGVLGAEQYFRYIYTSHSFQHGLQATTYSEYNHAQGSGTKTGWMPITASSIVNGLIEIYDDVNYSTYFGSVDSEVILGGGNTNNLYKIKSKGFISPTFSLQLYDTSVNDINTYPYLLGYGIVYLGNGHIRSTGKNAHAEGLNSLAIGNNSHAEGEDTRTIGFNSHAEGDSTEAIGKASHAEGNSTKAIGDYSHAEGLNSLAIGDYSHAEGYGSTAGYKYFIADSLVNGTASFYNDVDNAYDSIFSGNEVIISSQYYTFYSSSYIAPTFSIYLDNPVTLAGFLSVVPISNLNSKYADQDSTNGTYSHAEGYNSRAIGDRSHAEGNNTFAIGISSHAEGSQTKAVGLYSHAEGRQTITLGDYSNTKGYNTTASNDYSFAAGFNTLANGDYQFVIGRYNTASTSQSAFIIGDGISDANRHNILFISKSHFEVSASKVFFQGLPTSPETNLLVYNTESGQVYYTSSNTLITPPFPYTGSAGVTGSIELTGSMFVSGAISASFGENTVGFYGTASWAQSASFALTAAAFPSDTFIQYNKEGILGATGSFRFIYTSQSFQQGNDVTASGFWSHAQGSSSLASGPHSHAEGYFTTASGESSHAEGYLTVALGSGSHAEGWSTTASGDYSHAEGLYSLAFGTSSHAEGTGTIAFGNYSHAEGWENIALGSSSHAEGQNTTASGFLSHAEGLYTLASGQASHTEGKHTTASGNYSHAEGYYTWASGSYSHAEGGGDDKGNYLTAYGDFSHAEGLITVASGSYSHAEGTVTIARGPFSHAEGVNTIAFGSGSHAEGFNTYAEGYASHTEGAFTLATKSGSHAEGWNTTASGLYSHAEGSSSLASGNYSHAEGRATFTKSNYSYAAGYSSSAESEYQHVIGQFNKSLNSQSAFIIGDGDDNDNRHNVLFVSKSHFEVDAPNVFLKNLPQITQSYVLTYNSSTDKVSYANAPNGYKSYIATFTSIDNNPNVTVYELFNNTGADITWANIGPGNHISISASSNIFNANYTHWLLNTPADSIASPRISFISRSNDSELCIKIPGGSPNYSIGFSPSVWGNIEIKIFPEPVIP